MTDQDISRSGIDRRSIENSEQEEILYNGPERRSGKDRRIWVDRMQEITMKLK
jgi:hypothetical protein